MDNPEVSVDLSHWLEQFLAEPPNPLAAGDPIEVGTYCLAENPQFFSALLDHIAKKTGQFEPFDGFLRRFSVGTVRPVKPDPDDPSLYRNPPPVPKSSKIYKVYQALVFSKRSKEYRKALGNHSQNDQSVADLRARYSKDESGYCQFLLDRLPHAQQAFAQSRQVLRIAESRRAQHTYVSGMSGSGKSETMKTILSRYLVSPEKCALVVIDPHGKFGTEISKWPESIVNDRLVLIDPTLHPEMTPIVNPFDLKNPTPETIDLATQNLVGAFCEILKGEAGITLQMETVLKSCISSLLMMEGSHIGHLMAFMDDDVNGPLIDYARQHDPNAANRNFFDQDISKSKYSVTKGSIRTKIQSLLSTALFLNFVVGKSTLDLDAAIRDGKLIVFNLSRGTIGPDASGAMGRLILCMIQNIAMARAGLDESELLKLPRIHAFIDEFQNFVAPSVERTMTETRKYRLHLTVANQFIGQVDDRRVKDAVMGNTAVKISGSQPDMTTLNALSGSMQVPVEVIQNLKVGNFLYKIGSHPPLVVQNPDTLLGDRHGMGEEPWERVKAYQAKRYYRPIPDTETMVSRLQSLPKGISSPEPPETPPDTISGQSGPTSPSPPEKPDTEDERPSWMPN